MRDVFHFYQTEKIENGLVFYTRYSGPLTLDVFMESSVNRTIDVDYENARFIVIDVQEAVLTQLTAEDIQMMALRTRAVITQRPHIVYIVVAADPFSYGISRMWYGAVKQEGDAVYVVRSEEQAMETIRRIRQKRNF
ncbi:MAG: hypothetical protein JXR45_21000 [Deltaproteobacteria bacterium]|nr:hypothetical protein [Deltaproteobacteria bacterium]